MDPDPDSTRHCEKCNATPFNVLLLTACVSSFSFVVCYSLLNSPPSCLLLLFYSIRFALIYSATLFSNHFRPLSITVSSVVALSVISIYRRMPSISKCCTMRQDETTEVVKPNKSPVDDRFFHRSISIQRRNFKDC